ncbi:(2Fe-2S)-binding protein [Alkalicoccus urumqiensis]|uniref:Xanthine dehydrogenase subunit E n=1 Tax=Alkalicoccus urumqiensis TaxID=1548213 RepID=A0A2P6MLM3_ALKUR|nr:2Fe-2S iron-sulfur cluster-binding protein [Alkalicoccus urumqiensis]PRO67179.1 xanthine dehydrogenase subunit E [Alkalicoccus urumqiensis]
MTEKTAEYTLSINGSDVVVPADGSRRLIDILREDLQLKGTKISCEIGRCGACMVLVDGRAMNACLLMAYQCSGREIETIEGIRDTDITEAFLEEGAMQCGYCTPGMVVSLTGMLRQDRERTREELEEGLTGNLCRCTGYGGMHRVLERLSVKESHERSAVR